MIGKQVEKVVHYVCRAILQSDKFQEAEHFPFRFSAFPDEAISIALDVILRRNWFVSPEFDHCRGIFGRAKFAGTVALVSASDPRFMRSRDLFRLGSVSSFSQFTKRSLFKSYALSSERSMQLCLSATGISWMNRAVSDLDMTETSLRPSIVVVYHGELADGDRFRLSENALAKRAGQSTTFNKPHICVVGLQRRNVSPCAGFLSDGATDRA
jgi:hypothetical protein